MSKKASVRKIPKKTVFLIIVMAIIAVVGFVFVTATKNMKMEEVLMTSGHQNIKSITVANVLSVEDKETKIKSTVYKVNFTDLDLNKKCIGFVHRSNNGKYTKDIDCK